MFSKIEHVNVDVEIHVSQVYPLTTHVVGQEPVSRRSIAAASARDLKPASPTTDGEPHAHSSHFASAQQGA